VAKLAWLSIALAVLLAACTDAGAFGSTAAPTATRFVQPTVTRLPFAATQTAEALRPAYVIERIAFAMNVSPDGSPVEEISVIPADTRNLFLTVQITGAQPETIFRAYWFEGGEIIGQSEIVLPPGEEPTRWVALGFRAPAAMNPAAPHSVELRINDRKIDTYTFRVGIGEIEDVLADAFMALGTNGEQIVGKGELFDILAGQLVGVVRVSNIVDPSGMIFSAFWYRGETLVGQGQPDGGQPHLPADPQPLDRRLTFTFAPPGGLMPGDYALVIMINGAKVRELPFTIVSEQLPTPTAPPAPRVTATPTPPASGVAVRDMRVVYEVDPGSGAPTGSNVDRVETSPSNVVNLQVAVQLANLRIDDVVEVDVLQNGRAFVRYRYPVAAFQSGWMSVTARLTAPARGDPAYAYEMLIFVNGTRVRAADVEVALQPEYR
jgi:hypothetical protein